MTKKRLKLKKKSVPLYGDGGFSGVLKNGLDFAKNTVRAGIDTLLTPLGASNVIQDSDYTGTGSKFAKGYSKTMGGIGAKVLPMAAGMIGGPMAGAAVGVAQKGISEFTPQAEQVADPAQSMQPMAQEQVNNDPYNYFEFGGLTRSQPNATASLEKQETFRLPNGKVNSVDVDSHESGRDIDLKLPPKTEIWSDKLTFGKGGKTFAKLSMPYINSIKKQDKKIESGEIDKLTESTLNRNKDNANKALDNLFAHQESMKQEQATKAYSKFMAKWGGRVPNMTNGGRLPKYGDAGRVSTEIQLPEKQYWNGTNPLGHSDEMFYNMTGNRQYNQVGVNVTPDNQMEMTDYGQSPVSSGTSSNIGSPSYNKTGSNSTGLSEGGDGFNMNNALQLAPIAYNAIRGLQKPQQLNHEDYQNPYESETRRLMRNRNVDFKPIRDEIQDTYRGGLRNVGSGQKSSGAVLSGKVGLFGSKMNALAKARMNADVVNQGYRGEEASTLANLGANRAKTKLGITDYNARALAAKNSYLGQAAQDTGEYGQFQNINDMEYNLAENMYPNLKYDRKTKRYKNK